MIQKIKNKIQSESGVSFLFALLTFMVAAMVSVTIVAAASTTMKRVHNDRKEQQELLALTSATHLIRDEMFQTKYKITETTPKSDGVASGETQISHNIEGIFGTEIKNAIDALKAVDTYTSTSNAIMLEVEKSVSTDVNVEIPKVNVSFTMNKKGDIYNLNFVISTGQSGKTMFLKMDGKEEKAPTVESENKIINVTTISWGNPRISDRSEE